MYKIDKYSINNYVWLWIRVTFYTLSMTNTLEITLTTSVHTSYNVPHTHYTKWDQFLSALKASSKHFFYYSGTKEFCYV